MADKTHPEARAAVTRGRLKASRQTRLDVVRGRVKPHHRCLLRLHLD